MLMVSKSILVVLILAIFVSVVASSSLGYLVGSQQSNSFQSAIIALNQTKTVTTTITASALAALPAGSFPIQPNPFEFSEDFEGSISIWYMPLVFLGEGSTSQMYVNYDCDGPCGFGNGSISNLGIVSSVPSSYSISQEGKISPTTSISFTSGSLVESKNTSETIVYTVSISAASGGFYTFAIPYGCNPEPVLYIKTGTITYSPLDNWLKSINPADIGCSDSVQTTILGFTNSYYTEIPLQLNSTA